ncbi:MAG: hypothetical protein KF851_12295 [Pirellulaceae bacterium]|nr:hypothetical protein [Pirellulaceae bacterium]
MTSVLDWEPRGASPNLWFVEAAITASLSVNKPSGIASWELGASISVLTK